MNRLGTFLSSAAILALVSGAAGDATAGKPKKPGPKPVTQPCTLSGDATGGGHVGISVTAYGDLTMTVVPDTDLARALTVLPAGSYYGIGRVLKKNGRLDFAFNDDGSICRLAESGDTLPIDNSDVCRYRLILEFGLYDRKADLVRFELADSRARLWDFQQELNDQGELDPVGIGEAIMDVQFE